MRAGVGAQRRAPLCAACALAVWVTLAALMYHCATVASKRDSLYGRLSWGASPSRTSGALGDPAVETLVHKLLSECENRSELHKLATIVATRLALQARRDMHVTSPGSGADTTLGRSTDDASPSTSGMVDVDRAASPYTQQTCYIASDESELCVFDGLVCFDGESPLVFTPRPYEGLLEDGSTGCIDARYYEPSSFLDSDCALSKAGARSSYNTSRPISPSTGYAMSLSSRRWGPHGRNGGLTFRERTLSSIGVTETVDMPALRAGWAGGAGASPLPGRLLQGGPFMHENVSGLTLAARTSVGGGEAGGTTIDWLPGPLWLAGLDGQWASNPFHWWSKVGALYDARRANATPSFGDNPDDGYIQHTLRAPSVQSIVRSAPSPGPGRGTASALLRPPFSTANSAAYKVGPQWGPLPPMDTVIFTGDGARGVKSAASLGGWYRSVLSLALPPGSTATFNDYLSTLSPSSHLVCSAHGGAIPSSKPKWFTGRGDAWMWRQYAYVSTGLSGRGVRPHPKYPPRMITLLDRKGLNGRGLHNRNEVIAAIAATGVPYQVLDGMGNLTFPAQVEAMAGTGVLLAPHGAALANAMFLPSHAVVIEMFPFGMKKNTYR